MARTGPGVRLAPGIYRHTTWIRACAKVRGVQRERHFPLGTDLDAIRKWQLRTKATLLGGPLPTRATRGTLDADAPTYLASLLGKRLKDDRAVLQHWVLSPLGRIPRALITRAQVRTQLARWEEAGVPPATLNHRLRVLRNLYRGLDGEDEPNPTDKVKYRRRPGLVARGQPMDLIEAIIAYMPDRGARHRHGTCPGLSLSKARARVLAWTGLPPSQVMQLLPVHFNRQAGTLVVQPRRKGKGVPGTTLPLLPKAIDALVHFFQIKAEGRFSTASFRKSWLAAQRALLTALRQQAADRGEDPEAIVMPPIRPYDMRHSFGTEAYRRSQDILGVRQLMLHAETRTTERYIEGAAAAAAAATIKAWAADS